MKLKIFLVVSILMYVFAECPNLLEAAIQKNQKSTVLLIINNIAKSKHDQRLNEIMQEGLQKKIDRLYYEEDAKTFLSEFAGRDNSELTVEDMLKKIIGSKADYLIYAELKPFSQQSEFNFIYHHKEVTATFLLRIIDVQKKQELYSSIYSITAKDSTDYLFIGSGSVSRKAIHSVLFRAGEAISAHLPL